MGYLKDKTDVVIVKVPQELKEKIKTQAKELDMTVSAIVRDVLTTHFNK